MDKLNLIIAPNKILKSISVPVEFGTDISNELKQMKSILLENGAIGLSAPQIGINKTYFIMNIGFVEDNIVTVINPKIDYLSHLKEKLEECCLSLPDKIVKVNRSTTIHVVYYDENWKEQNMYLSGIKARIFQHEYDHLIGKCLL